MGRSKGPGFKLLSSMNLYYLKLSDTVVNSPTLHGDPIENDAPGWKSHCTFELLTQSRGVSRDVGRFYESELKRDSRTVFKRPFQRTVIGTRPETNVSSGPDARFRPGGTLLRSQRNFRR